MDPPADRPATPVTGARPSAAIAAALAWIAMLAVPNVLALPLWPWSPATWTATGIEDATSLAWPDAMRALVLGVVVSSVLLAAVGRLGRFALLTLPLVLLVPIEAWYIVNYGQPSNAHVLGILAETNAEEAVEFMGGSIAAPLVAYGVFAGVAIAAAWLIQRAALAWSHRSRVWIPAIVLGTAAVAAVTSVAGPGSAHARRIDASPAGSAWRESLDEYASVYPWGLVARVADYAAQRRAIREQVANARAVRIGATLEAGVPPLDVVLVVGESARADRFGTGDGAPRTSPRLARLEGLVSFGDVVSHATATRLAVPRIVTGVVPAPLASVTAQPSVVAAFREAGYRTWWISNHSTVGAHDSTIAPYAEEAHVRRFVNAGSAVRQSALDGALVPELDRALSTTAERRFIVLHMLGSHFNYRYRYPDAFDRFKPSIERDQATSIFDVAHRDAIRNAYDNSVLYTDHVLAEMIAVLERTGRDSVLLYVSDHGQVLFEGMCGKAGHGVPSALAYRVPMLVWLSPGVRRHRPDAYANLVAHRTAPLTLESVAPTLLDLGSVRIAAGGDPRSVAGTPLSVGPRRVTSDGQRWLDFDRDIPPIDCATSLERARRRAA
jgi:glucan phosphoethanolaminetransferase (alkaline phosphatase superfamily)